MARNVYWTIKYGNGWLNYEDIAWTRKQAIKSYMERFRDTGMRNWSWEKHKCMRGVSAVKVRLTELEAK